jgi:hypothetical protein
MRNLRYYRKGRADLVQLSTVAAAAGLFSNSAVVGLYALFAQSFPTEMRAGGGIVDGPRLADRCGCIAFPATNDKLKDWDQTLTPIL